MIIDDILQKLGLKYEDLNKEERETLLTWADALDKNKLTLANVKDYIVSMRDSVERDLTDTKHNTRKDILLKARLRNYMLLEAFLTSPEKAKQAIERAMTGIVKKKE